MSCPPQIAEILLEILRTGLLNIRVLGWGGDSTECASEADHLHNLPQLLSNYSPELLRFYWEVEKPSYCQRSEGNSTRFARAWERLHELLKQDGYPSSV